MEREIPKLSKSRFLSGLQCLKRLWLECHARELAAPADPFAQAILAAGRAVGELARRRFPGGRLVAEDHTRHEEAVGITAALLADPTVPAIYEAAFTAGDVRIRTDVLLRDGTGFDLFEVKASTGAKEEHLWDVAVQLRVLEAAGIRIRSARLLHLNGAYTYPGGDYDLAELFTAVDLTAEARERQPAVAEALANMRRSLASDTAPDVAVGRHCVDPWPCPFFDHCHQGLPEHSPHELPHASERLLERLATDGIRDLRHVPAGLDGFSDLQRRVLEAVQTGQRFHDPQIREALSAAMRPIHFLDFETFSPALPIYPGTRPYQAIPFQWSSHVLGDDGVVAHDEFLHDGGGDPRRRFAETLLEATRGSGSIVVYSGYEERCLRELEEALPDVAGELAVVRARLFDLHPVIRANVYDPAFHGSFSLKVVLPTLLPHLGYDDLEIRDGALASLSFAELVDPATVPERATGLRAALLAYCRRDTEAMLELYRLLR